jgi:hypothetical protein
VARVLVVFDDLLLGSNVLGMLRAAGFDLVVPRSRMAREGASLVGRLV